MSHSIILSASPVSSPLSQPRRSTTERRNSQKHKPSRDSHHDWQSQGNKSIITQANLYHDLNNSCCDKFCRLFRKFPMLSPFGPFRCAWDIIVMFMLIYTSLEVPFTLGFGIELNLRGQYYEFGIIAFAIDICLLCDILLNFRTAFFDKYDDLRLISSPKRIALRYIKGWFVLDLLTSFPFEFLPNAGGGESNVTTYIKILRIFRLFRIVKILRLLKMVKLFDGFVSNIIAREMMMLVRLFKVLCFALLSAHMCACLWYYTGCNSQAKYDISWIEDKGIIASHCEIGDVKDDHGLFVRYSFSWYWSVVTLFTTGYGDVVATNPYEQWVASVVILIGTCLFGYFVGTITSLITEGDKVSSMITDKLEDAQHFCQQKKLPREMARAVLTHTRYHCNHNYVLGDESEVLSNLPSYLAMDVSLYIAQKYLDNLDFLSNEFIDPYIRGLIALKMKSISCNKGYKLFVKGDVAEKIYIQRIGKSDHLIYDKARRKPFKSKIKRGDVIGEYALFQKKRDSTLVAQTWCEYYVLDVNDIKEILSLHYGEQWLKKFENIEHFMRACHGKPLKQRKKRHCLFRDNPLLPSFQTQMQSDNSTVERREDSGEEGHILWDTAEQVTERNNLRDLEQMTNDVLNANRNDLNNNNVCFGLNALSRNAHKISKLTTDKNKHFIKSKIRHNFDFNLNSSAIPTLTGAKSLFRGLTRQNSFFRDLEVTKDFKLNNDTDSSSDNDESDGNGYESKEEMPSDNDGKRETLKVADAIVVEMMQFQSDLHHQREEDIIDLDSGQQPFAVVNGDEGNGSEEEEEMQMVVLNNSNNNQKRKGGGHGELKRKKKKNHKTHC